MSKYERRSHNVSVLLYHLVFPAKYRLAVVDDAIECCVRDTCLEIERRYEVKFLEIGSDRDHMRFLAQSVPSYSVTKIVTLLKSLKARQVFARRPEVKRQLWGGEFWSDGYFASTVDKHGDEATIANYVKSQGSQDYRKLHDDRQLRLF